MKLSRQIGEKGFRWPTLLEVGAQVTSDAGRRMRVVSIEKNGTVILED